MRGFAVDISITCYDLSDYAIATKITNNCHHNPVKLSSVISYLKGVMDEYGDDAESFKIRIKRFK